MPIGGMVTLRGQRMYEFLDRDHARRCPASATSGASAEAFDGRGNYTLGLNEQLVFPEIDYDKIDKVRGMEITIVTTAKTDEEGRQACSQLLGMPFARPASRRKLRVAKMSMIVKSLRKPQFRGPAAQPLRRLRTAARLHAQVRTLPHLLPRACPRGPAARRDEVELVGEGRREQP